MVCNICLYIYSQFKKKQNNYQLCTNDKKKVSVINFYQFTLELLVLLRDEVKSVISLLNSTAIIQTAYLILSWVS